MAALNSSVIDSSAYVFRNTRLLAMVLGAVAGPDATGKGVAAFGPFAEGMGVMGFMVSGSSFVRVQRS
jgi:hypothetical protein